MVRTCERAVRIGLPALVFTEHFDCHGRRGAPDADGCRCTGSSRAIVTEARRLLAAADPPLSLTAFVVASVGRAAAAHPQVHAYRDWRGRLVEHHVRRRADPHRGPTGEGPFGLVHVVRDADTRAVDDVTAGSAGSSTTRTPTTPAGGCCRSVAPALGRVPGLYPAMYAAHGPVRDAPTSRPAPSR